MSNGTPESLEADEGVTLTDNAIAHVLDLGANYWSLWNWHDEKAENVLRYYRRYPEMIDTIAVHGTPAEPPGRPAVICRRR